MQSILIPLINPIDAKTAVTTASLPAADVSINGGVPVDRNSADPITYTGREPWWQVPLDDTDTNTSGGLLVSLYDPTQFLLGAAMGWVMEQAYFDAIFSTAKLLVDVRQIDGVNLATHLSGMMPSIIPPGTGVGQIALVAGKVPVIDQAETGSVVSSGSNTASSFDTTLTGGLANQHARKIILFTSGNLIRQIDRIASSGTDGVVTVENGFPAVPQAGDTFKLVSGITIG